MTAYPWLKLWIGTADDPKLRAAARMAGCHKAIAVNAWLAALEYAGEHQERGSIKGFLPEVIAEICDTTREVAVRLFQALRELGMLIGDRIAKWAQRQKEKVQTRSNGAERTARYRRNKAAKAAQGVLDLAASQASQASQTTVTSATEEEGESQRIPTESISNTESVAAREGSDKNEVDSFGRDAPLIHPLGHGERIPVRGIALESTSAQCPREPESAAGNVVRLAEGPTLKAKKKEMRRMKVVRFIKARYSGEEQQRRLEGMFGLDPVRDEQWWFDKCDAERIVAGWDDARDKQSSWRSVS